MRNAFAYVAGFSLVFIAFGAALGAAGAAANALELVPENRLLLVRAGGIVLIVLGLYQTGLVRIPFLDRERRLSLSPGTMAAGQGSIERATLLLSIYTLGLGVPFLVVAAAFGNSTSIIRRVNAHMHTITLVSGAVMLGVGIIMVLGIYQSMFTEIIRLAPWTPWEPSL
jgi:cytochrome c-type biogenesis protein